MDDAVKTNEIVKDPVKHMRETFPNEPISADLNLGGRRIIMTSWHIGFYKAIGGGFVVDKQRGLEGPR